MAIAAGGDARGRPVLPYAADETAQVTAHLNARGSLAGRSTATGRLVAVS
jgi:hypothetical protein